MPPPTLIGTARDRPASVPNGGRPAPIPSLALPGTEVGALSAQLAGRQPGQAQARVADHGTRPPYAPGTRRRPGPGPSTIDYASDMSPTVSVR
eukprot:354246-Hanusia_phi.AAC.1